MAKKPSNSDKKSYIGIEVEFFCLAMRSASAKFTQHPLSEYAELGSDSSIRTPTNNFYNSHELRILTPYDKLQHVMDLFDDYINKVKGKVNNSCGLHIHLDMRNRDAAKAYENLIARQEEMYNSVPAKRRNNDYCERLDTSKVARIARALRGESLSRSQIRGKLRQAFEELGIESYINSYTADQLVGLAEDHQGNQSSDHYDGISAHPFLTKEYKTLEVRVHEGTVDSEEIRAWVRYLYEASFGELSSTSKTYINQRVAAHG